MDLDKYMIEAAKFDGKHPLDYYFLKLGAEAGEVQQERANFLKKKPGYGIYYDGIVDELGDVMWYFIRICALTGISPGEVLDKNIEKLTKRHLEKTDNWHQP